MLRRSGDADVRAERPRGRRRIAPAPLRAALIAALVAALAGAVGGPHGFWLGLPGVLLAGSIGASAGGVVAYAAPALLADATGAALSPGSSIPPLWLVLIVPASCLLVLYELGRRLRRERDLMRQAAFSDPLTGLANRRMLLSVAAHELARHRRAQEPLTVVMLDLDGFKLLNDRFGHAAGDRMLRAVADHLAGALRSQDTVARLGGDEFCVLAPATANRRALTDKIVAAVAGAAGGHRELRTSVGVAAFPQDGGTIELLLQRADERLLSAKHRLHATARQRAA
ncbi:MAG: GGDEF domain-containing protein [Acidobacteriota bacterium]|nr:GGDEF domain-containing protein [Acidobacteriota bacterium]